MTLSEARKEKNLQDEKDNYKAKKLIEKNAEIILYLESKIEKEKEAIKNCINLNLFSFAKAKIKRIEDMKRKISDLL